VDGERVPGSRESTGAVSGDALPVGAEGSSPILRT
jgi:hypothetical protein